MSEWEFPCCKGKAEDDFDPKDTAHSWLNFFMKLYFIEYINDVVIPDTNKHLNSDMNLSEYVCVSGCCSIMDCYVGHSVRDFFLKYPIISQKGTPICPDHIISGRGLDKITQVMPYKHFAIPGFNNIFFQQRQIQEVWKKNMAAQFFP